MNNIKSQAVYTYNMDGLTGSEIKKLKKLSTPLKIQDYLNSLPMNFGENGDTCMSPRRVLREGKAHCMEGALLAAASFRINGSPPLVIDLTATKRDDDHVVAPYRKRGFWGAVSKTNHGVLRYREPIYKTVRELILSYFHEYFMDDGSKSLRSYTDPVDLSRFDKKHWMTSEEDVWYIPEHLVSKKHIRILSRWQIAGLRKADLIELRATGPVEWEKTPPKTVRFNTRSY